MAAYSAVVCFRQTLKQLLDSDEFPPYFPKLEIQSLHDKVFALQSSLDRISFVPKKWRKDMNELQSRVRDAIYAAQDKVEYAISNGRSSEKFDEVPLKETVDVFDLIAEEMAESISNDPQAQNLFSENLQPSEFSFRVKDIIVGQEEDFRRVTNQLLSEDTQRQVIPIMGVPGIGKTTLARSIYEYLKNLRYFDICAWVAVSQNRNFQEIFSKILSSMESRNDGVGHYSKQGDEETLLKHIQQELNNLKYLIILDDVRDQKVWDRVMQALPDMESGSRVLLTTRAPEVVNDIQKFGFIHEMRPLSPDDSWTLLCYKLFEEDGDHNYPMRRKDITEACPLQLRDIGMSIAKKCKGLPLSITMVGGLLSQNRQKMEYWKTIEEDVSNAASAGESSYEEILSLSYSHLPGKLKGCFLYMGGFPEDSEIRVSKLIKLWVAEGFLVSPPDQSVEVVARRSLEDLVGRNLISVRRKSSNGGMKVCGIHDSLWEVAVHESRKEKFFHSRKKYAQRLEEDMQSQRRVSVHRNILMCLEDVYESTRSIKHARTLLYVGSHHHHPLSFCLTFDLLRVLDAFTVYFTDFPSEFLQLVHLRYLSFTYNHDLSPKLAQLQNLQVLMVRRQPKIIFVGVSFLPDEIWMMRQLRHLWFTETDFPAIPRPEISDSRVLLPNLQTLANVNAAFFTDEVLDNMPNLTKLAMWIDGPAGIIGFSLKRLSKLECFKFVVVNPIPGKGIEVEAEHLFPKTLRQLNLSGCGLPWEYMRFVADELPDLQVLKLRELAFHGDEWSLDYKFKNLKYLLIEHLNLKTWEAGDMHFPNLQRLIVRHCYELEEIPSDIVYIEPLELIELVECSPDVVASAEDIQQTLLDLGKETQVRVFTSWE